MATDTDLVRQLDGAKNDPRAVAEGLVTAIGKGESELIADGTSSHVKAALSGPVEALNVSR